LGYGLNAFPFHTLRLAIMTHSERLARIELESRYRLAIDQYNKLLLLPMAFGMFEAIGVLVIIASRAM
jgi:hypothetical protein